jgi:hypothetical protein
MPNFLQRFHSVLNENLYRIDPTSIFHKIQINLPASYTFTKIPTGTLIVEDPSNPGEFILFNNANVNQDDDIAVIIQDIDIPSSATSVEGIAMTHGTLVDYKKLKYYNGTDFVSISNFSILHPRIRRTI